MGFLSWVGSFRITFPTGAFRTGEFRAGKNVVSKIGKSWPARQRSRRFVVPGVPFTQLPGSATQRIHCGKAAVSQSKHERETAVP